jgi:predicted RNA polymerase sigma factor
VTGKVAVDDLLRELTPLVLGAVVRRYGHFDAAEDAVQEALLAAAVQWPAQGRPANPRAWLITVASRRLTDQLRADDARQRYEASAAALVPPDEFLAPAADEEHPAERTKRCACCSSAATRRSRRPRRSRSRSGPSAA